MATDNHKIDTEESHCYPDFLQPDVDLLPVIIYINALERPGDIRSFHNLWMNQPGCDLIGCSQKRISHLGYDFFSRIIHPDDLKQLDLSIKTNYRLGTAKEYMMMLRIKCRKCSQYKLFCCIKTVIETFGDGSLKTVFVKATEINGLTHPYDLNNPIRHVKEEIEDIAPSFHFTPREKEILQLIINGEDDRDIASHLYISYQTARTHRNNMLRKSGMKNSAALVAMAVASGINFISVKKVGK